MNSQNEALIIPFLIMGHLALYLNLKKGAHLLVASPRDQATLILEIF
jgi:hypothetical protein